MLRLEQELFHLYPDSFGRQIAEIHTPTEFDCFGINVQLKTRRELRCTQHAQAVFGKRLARHGTQHALLNVSLPSVGMDALAGERIIENRVDCKVAGPRWFGNAPSRMPLY